MDIRKGGAEKLVDVVLELSTARTLEDVQRIVRHAARELTGADGATFVLRDVDQCFYADEDAIEPLWKGRRFPMSACISGWAMLNRRPAVIEDIYVDPRIPAEAYRPTFVKSLAMVPIRTAEPIGAIGNYWATRHMPTDEEVYLLQALADSASIALENVRLFAELEQQVRSLRETEHQLRHSQKMEAIGRLASGVAHDFNNVLTVVLLNCDIVGYDVTNPENVQSSVQEIRMAGERAAAITRQLLTFSRKHVVHPSVVDVNRVVGALEKMLRQIVGKRVAFSVAPAPRAHAVFMDAGQLEQVLVNLAVNARDAMPDGGNLVIETSNVRFGGETVNGRRMDGDYVMIAVSDSGVGMDQETLGRIFEPFFTTKEAGKGTGLGLSTTFGIIKEAGGHIWVYSEPGHGTTFKIYLPKFADAPVDTAKSTAELPVDGTETILLVEDDGQVRTAAQGILEKAGYRVIEAKSVDDAIRIASSNELLIDLLLTDVVMPKMTGVDLAEVLQKSLPRLKVLCMSGFTDESLYRHGMQDLGLAFVQKPLTRDGLLTKIRQVLDS